ncbi:pickpocket protein 28-like isoform X1 [Helicoverpa zea]|uniref:pickpocket protein 28-like isoform X1 n=1 Tax=Helicoverpa zea TaxID=7113 RepID=UPI001F596B2E|nr:pickpocket protein 28-like isoform X1 [Helicoverpa zea]
MFSERSFQAQIIQDDLQRTPKNNFIKPKNKRFHNVVIDKTKNYFKLFLETSSIHGLNHLVSDRRHVLEIFLWFTIIFFSAFGSLYLSQMTWSRYQSSPTVVSMDRDMYAWNTTFPCVTVCPVDYIDKRKLDIYLRNSNEENKTKLESFILTLANSSYRNFEDIPDYEGVTPDKYIQLLLNLSLPFKPTLTIGVSNVVLSIVPTITEMGLCYSVNSRTAEYNSPEYRDTNRWDVLSDEKKSLFIHPLDGEVFAQVMNISTAYNVYIHGPQEVPDISTKFQRSANGYYMKLYVTALTVYTSPEASRLSVNQRRCRFPHENNLKHNSIYTYTMCRMECRIRLCLKYCHCIPHFYRRIGDEKLCDIKGLHCLSKHKDELYKLQDSTGKRINCGCYPLCDDVNYVLQSNALQVWFLGTNLQWGMVTYPRMRYRRDIIFGFTDVLVAVGGMAGLFLGCSVLSFMEVVYFLTLRLFCYAHTSK